MVVGGDDGGLDCVTAGDTREETEAMGDEAVQLFLEDLRETANRSPTPRPKPVTSRHESRGHVTWRDGEPRRREPPRFVSDDGAKPPESRPRMRRLS